MEVISKDKPKGKAYSINKKMKKAKRLCNKIALIVIAIMQEMRSIRLHTRVTIHKLCNAYRVTKMSDIDADFNLHLRRKICKRKVV